MIRVIAAAGRSSKTVTAVDALTGWRVGLGTFCCPVGSRVREDESMGSLGSLGRKR